MLWDMSSLDVGHTKPPKNRLSQLSMTWFTLAFVLLVCDNSDILAHFDKPNDQKFLQVNNAGIGGVTGDWEAFKD